MKEYYRMVIELCKQSIHQVNSEKSLEVLVELERLSQQQGLRACPLKSCKS